MSLFASPAGMAQTVKNTLDRTINRRFKSLQCCMYMCKYVDKKRLSFNIIHQKISRCHSRGESEESIEYRRGSMKVRVPPWPWNPGQMSPEVQNRGISEPRKRTPKMFFKKCPFCSRHRLVWTMYNFLTKYSTISSPLFISKFMLVQYRSGLCVAHLLVDGIEGVPGSQGTPPATCNRLYPVIVTCVKPHSSSTPRTHLLLQVENRNKESNLLDPGNFICILMRPKYSLL